MTTSKMSRFIAFFIAIENIKKNDIRSLTIIINISIS